MNSAIRKIQGNFRTRQACFRCLFFLEDCGQWQDGVGFGGGWGTVGLGGGRGGLGRGGVVRAAVWWGVWG